MSLAQLYKSKTSPREIKSLMPLVQSYRQLFTTHVAHITAYSRMASIFPDWIPAGSGIVELGLTRIATSMNC